MRTKLLRVFAILSIGAFVFSACSDDNDSSSGQSETDDNQEEVDETEDDGDKDENPQEYRIAVASDAHYFDPSLLVEEGKAFNDYVKADRKLICESNDILDQMFEQIIAQKPQFLMITGDLTKDGEMVSHQNFAKKLRKVEQEGIKVFVTPGNHDINNPHALEYYKAKATPVARVNPSEFKAVYKEFGYDESEQIEAGPRLSYVAEPVNGLWLINIDSNIYDNNIAENYPRTEGALDQETINWVVSKVKEGKSKGKKVIAMMHHGLIEHFKHQGVLAGEYLINDYKEVCEVFARAGLEFIFTGHAHMQDISMRSIEGNNIYDIQTGSAITYPCPYRTVTITDDKFKIESHDISLKSSTTSGKQLRQYAYDDIYLGIFGLVDFVVEYRLGSGLFADAMISVVKFITTVNKELLRPFITDIYTNICAGDENGVHTEFVDRKTGKKRKTMDYAQEIFEKLHLGTFFPLLEEMTYDDYPSDNNLVIPLK